MGNFKTIDEVQDGFLNAKQYTISECISHKSELPKSGIYGWYFAKDAFKNAIVNVPYDGCVGNLGYSLLYVGIGPSGAVSKKPSKKPRILSDRLIKNHFNGSARNSTVRKSIGCLLREELGLIPRKMAGDKFNFGDSEEILSKWLRSNARVAFVAVDDPWLYEGEIISKLQPPLNINGDPHPFSKILENLRAETLHSL